MYLKVCSRHIRGYEEIDAVVYSSTTLFSAECSATTNPCCQFRKNSSDSIYVLKSDTSYTTFKNPIQFNSFIQIKVHGLSKLFQRSAEKKKTINLFLDGIEMKGIVPIGMDKSRSSVFILHRDSASIKQWQIVRRIILEEKKKELIVSVGLDGEEAYPSTLKFSAELSRAGDYYLAFLSYTFSIILFTFLVKRSNTLRKNQQIYTDAYSLSKTLMPFWVFIILFFYSFFVSIHQYIPTCNYFSISTIDHFTDFLTDCNVYRLFKISHNQPENCFYK